MARSIVGREAELARIDALLERGSTGPRVVLIEGQPGVGKTTVWAAAVERGLDSAARVLRSRPTDAEATFAYASLGDLLESVPDEAFADLPVPQRNALRVALLRAEPEGWIPEARAVAVAFLNTLRSISDDGPLLVAIDDIQWLDPPSAQVVGFALRRIEGAAVRWVLARRIEAGVKPPSALAQALDSVPHEDLELDAMDLGAMTRLLADRLGHSFPGSTLRRIHATSGGNPMFAIEVGRALLQASPSGTSSAEVPIPGTLLELVGEPVRALPDATQRALAVVALLAAPTVELVSDAVGAPAQRMLRPAVEAHVVVFEGDRIRFAHPLYAVAARDGLTPAERRATHAQLAEIAPDAEQRARHLAAAATGPDDNVAAALEAAALRARARGAPDASADLAAMARMLTPTGREGDATRRANLELWSLYLYGDYNRIREVAETLAASAVKDQQWEGRGFLAVVYCWGFDLEKGVALYRAAIEDLADDDARRLQLEGGITGALDLLGEDYREALAHGYAELELAERFGDESKAITALRGIARNEQRLTGRMPVELIERAVEREWVVREVREVAGWPTFCLADMLSWTDDLEAALGKWSWLFDEATARGETNSLIDILHRTILCECAAGRFGEALAHAEEGIELTRDRGTRVFEAIVVAERALVHAHLGDETAARRDAGEASRLAAGGNPQADRLALWALGLVELPLGNSAEAHARLAPLVVSRRAAGVAEPGELRFVPDAIEASIGAGRLDEAEATLDWFEGLAEASGRVIALAACRRCRGQLRAATDDIGGAIDELQQSLDLYERVEDPFGRARTLLALGSLERRRLQKRAARSALDAAGATFDRLGARVWARAARSELARIGGRAPSPDALTPTEAQVATLVAEGRTNREVAAILVVSERTVEGHLSRIYAKLGVRSRSELAHRLPRDSSARA